MPNFTHYLVVDSDIDDPNPVLAWFPVSEENALERATFMARDTGHHLAYGVFDNGFEVGQRWVP